MEFIGTKGGLAHDVVDNIDLNMDWELCTDLDNEFFTSAWQKFKGCNCEGRLLTDVLKSKYNLKRCKKSEATALLFIGVKNEAGAYKKGVKHYWLCSIKTDVQWQ